MCGETAGNGARRVQYAPNELGDGCNEQALPLVLWLTSTVESGLRRKAATQTCSDVARKLPAELEYRHGRELVNNLNLCNRPRDRRSFPHQKF